MSVYVEYTYTRLLPQMGAEMGYDQRRRYIRALIDDLDVSLAEVVRWTGRGDGRGPYQYVWQVLDGRKRSEAVLEDLESALRDRGLWREPQSWWERLWG